MIGRRYWASDIRVVAANMEIKKMTRVKPPISVFLGFYGLLVVNGNGCDCLFGNEDGAL